VIYQLPEDRYDRILPLCHGLDYQLIVTAVIEHTSPGRVLVDNPDHPTSCFLSTAEGCFLAGDPKNTSFNANLGTNIQARMVAGKASPADETELIVSVFPNEWTKHFPTIFPTKTPCGIPRYYYTCTQLKWTQPVPKSLTVKQLTQTLLIDSNVSMPDHITSWITSNWGSQDAFFTRGFGFAMIHQNQVISWSLADCVSGARCEIGIQTQPEYRRQGFATITAAAAVDFALQHGFTHLGWHTSEDNIGSKKVAEKVGFKKSTEYTWYLFRF
jgi:RimJ/RimL family protein N-acetyltransferase